VPPDELREPLEELRGPEELREPPRALREPLDAPREPPPRERAPRELVPRAPRDPLLEPRFDELDPRPEEPCSHSSYLAPPRCRSCAV
jgi:hypothetical protein